MGTTARMRAVRSPASVHERPVWAASWGAQLAGLPTFESGLSDFAPLSRITAGQEA